MARARREAPWPLALGWIVLVVFSLYFIYTPLMWFLGYRMNEWEDFRRLYNPKTKRNDRFAPCELAAPLVIAPAAIWLSATWAAAVIIAAVGIVLWSIHQRFVDKGQPISLQLWRALDIVGAWILLALTAFGVLVIEAPWWLLEKFVDGLCAVVNSVAGAGDLVKELFRSFRAYFTPRTFAEVDVDIRAAIAAGLINANDRPPAIFERCRLVGPYEAECWCRVREHGSVAAALDQLHHECEHHPLSSIQFYQELNTVLNRWSQEREEDRQLELQAA